MAISFTTIEQLRDQVAPKLHGTTLGKLGGSFYDKCREAANNVLMRLDPPSTKKVARIESAIYDHVYNYAVQDDLKGVSKICDIRPVGPRLQTDWMVGRDPRHFDIRKERDTMAVEYLGGVKTLRLSKALRGYTLVWDGDSLDVGGTVTGTGDASNLDVDNFDFVSGSGSVSFDLSGATGYGYIRIALPNSLDLSELEDVGALFSWIKFPDASRLQAVELHWGNDAPGTDEWYDDVASPHDRTAFESGAWTLQRHDWSGAGVSGTPDASAITHLTILISYDPGDAITGCRVDAVTAAKGEPWEIVYYSNRLFVSSAGAWLDTPTALTDKIYLDPEAQNIFLYELMALITQELRGADQGADYAYFRRALDGVSGDENKPGLYRLYEQKYPSEAVPVQTVYHDYGDIGVHSE